MFYSIGQEEDMLLLNIGLESFLWPATMFNLVESHLA
jgi:hypothetical protein